MNNATSHIFPIASFFGNVVTDHSDIVIQGGDVIRREEQYRCGNGRGHQEWQDCQ